MIFCATKRQDRHVKNISRACRRGRVKAMH